MANKVTIADLPQGTLTDKYILVGGDNGQSKKLELDSIKIEGKSFTDLKDGHILTENISKTDNLETAVNILKPKVERNEASLVEVKEELTTVTEDVTYIKSTAILGVDCIGEGIDLCEPVDPATRKIHLHKLNYKNGIKVEKEGANVTIGVDLEGFPTIFKNMAKEGAGNIGVSVVDEKISFTNPYSLARAKKTGDTTTQAIEILEWNDSTAVLSEDATTKEKTLKLKNIPLQLDGEGANKDILKLKAGKNITIDNTDGVATISGIGGGGGGEGTPLYGKTDKTTTYTKITKLNIDKATITEDEMVLKVPDVTKIESEIDKLKNITVHMEKDDGKKTISVTVSTEEGTPSKSTIDISSWFSSSPPTPSEHIIRGGWVADDEVSYTTEGVIKDGTTVTHVGATPDVFHGLTIRVTQNTMYPANMELHPFIWIPLELAPTWQGTSNWSGFIDWWPFRHISIDGVDGILAINNLTMQHGMGDAYFDYTFEHSLRSMKRGD